MNNVEIKVEGAELVIRIRLDVANPPRSNTGKTRLLASTGGAQPVTDVPGLKVAINAMVPVDGWTPVKASAKRSRAA